MTVYDLLYEFIDDVEVVIETESGEEIFSGTADEATRFYNLSGAEISSGITVWNNKLEITINPDEEELGDIREEIGEDGEDYSDFDEA